MSEMFPLISVIVPVYKVEPYLDRCVQSIVDQTYTNLEIILVDDGSPDGCPAMCDAWAERDSRIKVIHQPNGGLSDARNAGMAAATGEYIGFVDSDDWIEKEMYRELYGAMLATDSDIASCGARRVWSDGRPHQELCGGSRDGLLEGEAAMKALIGTVGLTQTVWNKLYKRSVALAVLFPVGQIHEDEFWSWPVIARAKRVATVGGTYYNYLQRDGSIMGAGFSESSVSVINARTERQDYIEKYMPDLSDLGRADITYSCMHIGVLVLKHMNGKNARRNMRALKRTIASYPVGRRHLRSLPWRKRIHLQMLRHLFGPTCRVHSR